MIKVRFHKPDGTLDREVEAKAGQRLLDVAWAAKQPLEGACEGVMACSTCHVIVDKERDSLIISDWGNHRVVRCLVKMVLVEKQSSRKSLTSV